MSALEERQKIEVSADVIADKIGQANQLAQSIAATPARKSKRATQVPKPRAASPADVPAQATPKTESKTVTPARDAILTTIRNLGRTLDDLERARIMAGNRVRAAQDENRVDPPWMELIDEAMRRAEHVAELELKRAWRKHPLAPWAKAIPGAGEVLMARLIAEIGDPAERPNPGKLLAYCGHGDPARAGKIPKGATQEELFKRGSPHAKKAVWKLSYQFMRTVGTPVSAKPDPDSKTPTPTRARSPYRDVYDERKTATEGKLHVSACVRCGPAGHPALPGSPWSDAHRHADALRVVGKRFLVDLWVAARAIEDTDASSATPEPLPEEST